MRQFLPLLTLLAFSPAAQADLHHRITSSVSLSVGGATTTANRLGSSWSVSGSGVDTTDGTTANTISAGTITSGVMSPGTISALQDNPGSAFSYSAAYTQADSLPTSAVSAGAVPNFGSIQSTAGGTAGSLGGTLSTAGAIGLTAGGENTSAIGQFVTELSID